MEFGIALAGGGTRGAAHVGVLLALEEEGLYPRSIAGTSAGSIVAGLYASGMRGKQMSDVVRYLAKKGHCYLDLDYVGIIKLIPQLVTGKKVSLTGLLRGDKLENYLCDLTGGKKIRDSCIRTVIPSVDLNSGKTIAYTNSLLKLKKIENVVWESDILLCEAMMASSSVPAVFSPRMIDGYCLVDGGVTNVLPVELLIGAGEKNVIGVDISEDYEMPEKDTIFEVASHSFSIMSSALKQCKSSGEKLLLKPDLPKEAGLLTFEYMTECMDAGYAYTKGLVGEIRRLCKA